MFFPYFPSFRPIAPCSRLEMQEKPNVSLVEEYLDIWSTLWTDTRYKQPLYDKIDSLWKSMTLEEKTQVNQLLREIENAKEKQEN